MGLKGEIALQVLSLKKLLTNVRDWGKVPSTFTQHKPWRFLISGAHGKATEFGEFKAQRKK